MNRILFPPLNWIAAELQGDRVSTAPAPDGENAVRDGANESGDASVEMPAFLREMVQRRIQSQSVYPDMPAAVGQIRAIRSIASASGPGRPLGRVCGILLGAHLGSQCWSGWLVAQEYDYATERDLVLDQDSGPIAPEAAIVQAWNPVRCYLAGDETLLGKVAASHLAAVFELADAQTKESDFVAPRPGAVGMRSLPSGALVLTGTPLGGVNDPRRAYQHLYGELARDLSAAAQSQPVPAAKATPPGVWGWLQDRLTRPTWALATWGLLFAQSLWIGFDLLPKTNDSLVYRSDQQALHTDPCVPRLRVVFKAGAGYGDVVLDLRRIEGALVDGPSDQGEVWIALHTDLQVRQAIRTLQLSKYVESVDASASPEGTCRK